jgi:hypothetical protein
MSPLVFAKGGLKLGAEVGVWRRIAIADVLGSAVSSVTFSGLNGDADIAYEIRGVVVKNSGGLYRFGVFPNNDTASHYFSHWIVRSLGGDATGGDTSGSALGMYLAVSADSDSQAWPSEVHFRIPNAKSTLVQVCSLSHFMTPQTEVGIAGTAWNTPALIASLVVSSNKSGGLGLGVGTHLELWTPRKA